MNKINLLDPILRNRASSPSPSKIALARLLVTRPTLARPDKREKKFTHFNYWSRVELKAWECKRPMKVRIVLDFDRVKKFGATVSNYSGHKFGIIKKQWFGLYLLWIKLRELTFIFRDEIFHIVCENLKSLV